jgi:soluble P-type ATPase
MMQKKIAVVFDSAGTLLHMYRVAKNIRTGEYIHDVITTDLVKRKNHYGLVIFHTDPDSIMECQPHKKISQFLQENNITINLSCSSSPITPAEVKESINNDSLTTMQDIHDVIHVVKNKCPEIFYLGIGIIVDVKSRSITYTICTGGKPFTNTQTALKSLVDLDVDSYISSGDSMRNLESLAQMVDIPVECVYDVASPQKKEWVIKHLKKQYDRVVMVGDGINDILAFRVADKAVLSIQQTGKCKEPLCSEADIIIPDILHIVKIVKDIKDQL